MDDQLLIRFIENKASDIEMIEVLDWIDADPENRKHFDELDFINTLVEVNKPSIFAQRAMYRRKNVLNRRRNIFRWSASAAAVLLICAGAGFWAADRTIDRKAGRFMTITVPRGQRINVTLSDGSDVWLNSGANLQYPAIFSGRERRVKVDGEAIFNVKKEGRKSSFVVETFAGDVRVLGTKFDVVAWRDENKFSVGLLEGSVCVRDRATDVEGITMKPGEMVRLVDGKLRLDGEVNEDDLLWVDGIISITGLSFEDVIASFERYYNVEITIERDDLPQIELQRGKIRISEGIDHALRALQHG
ncbi:MAG: FecR domain-containing protein, partial [Alistipes sp.]|nr:FecR domain-containing protein [Alistipes sp.]